MNKIMNVKKIRRLMHKYGLRSPIRKPNPYRQMAKAIKSSNYAPNIVNRDFCQWLGKVLLTDITFLFFGKEKCYLSTILDALTHEILSYQVSMNLKVDFVIKTVDELIAKHGSSLDNRTIVHSDQGCHYTSSAFIEKLKNAEFIQSMSRRDDCWDNAPQESFFGHLKDEIGASNAKCKTFENVKTQSNDWIDYYNTDRYQWDLFKLAPKEFHEYIKTGIYPLPVYVPIRNVLNPMQEGLSHPAREGNH